VRSERQREWAAAALVALVAFLPFARGVLSGASLYFRDLSLHFFPLRRFALEGLRRGELRFWNPYVHEGVPLSLPPLGYPLDLASIAGLLDRVRHRGGCDHPGGAIILSELLDHSVDQLRRDQGPGGVVDHHDLTGAQRQGVGDRFGAVLTAGDGDDPPPARGLLLTSRGGDHDLSDRRRCPEGIQRPLEHGPPAHLHEGLRATGSESFSGAGGRDHG